MQELHSKTKMRKLIRAEDIKSQLDDHIQELTWSISNMMVRLLCVLFGSESQLLSGIGGVRYLSIC